MLSNMDAIGKRIKELREEKGFKQEIFAGKVDVQVATLSRYENGRQTPTLENFVSIAQQLNVSTDYLLFGNGKEEIFNIDNNKDYESVYNETLCYSIATLIENDMLVLVNNNDFKGIAINSENVSIKFFEFYDKLIKALEIFESAENGDYKNAKNHLFESYSSKLFQNLDLYKLFPSEIMDDKRIKIEELLRNHKKIVKNR